MASVKGNIVLNGLNTITGIIFPVITFPYAARVIMPEGIGVVNFLNSIISYIILITSLGIPVYAVKEVAKLKDNKPERDKLTIEIIILSSILCCFGYGLVLILGKFVPQIHSNSELFYILSLSIVFSTIGVNWFYQGVEDFKFITIRGIIIRTLSAIALFIFVKDPSDLIIYGVIVVGSTVGNNMINFLHLRKFINFKYVPLSKLNLTKHIKPSFQIFILNLIVSLYVQLNSIMLGFFSNDNEVGYFVAGTKISHIALTLIASIGTVLLPRCSYLWGMGDSKGFNTIINKSLNLTLALSLPITVGLWILAQPITIVFCGVNYIPSIPVLLLNAPIVIILSLTNMIGIQILYPMDKTKIIIWSVLGGAIMNIAINAVLISKHGSAGAAFATLIAESTVLVIQLMLAKNNLPFRLSNLLNINYIAGSLLLGLAVYLTTFRLDNEIMKLCLGLFIGIIVYFTFLFIRKDKLLYEIIPFTTIKSKLNKIKNNGIS